MAKATTQAAATPAGYAAAKANRKPSKGTTQAAAPAPQAPATPAPVVALRGGLVLGQLKLSGKAYRVAAPHNVAWWATTQATIAQGKGTASTQAIVAAGVPASMVGYLYRRGYLATA